MPLRFSTLYRKTKPPVEISLILGVGGVIPPARAKDRGRPRRPARQSRATQKSFLFLLEEKIGRAQIGKSKENFFVGRAGFRHGGGTASLGVLLKVGSSKVQNFPYAKHKPALTSRFMFGIWRRGELNPCPGRVPMGTSPDIAGLSYGRGARDPAKYAAVVSGLIRPTYRRRCGLARWVTPVGMGTSVRSSDAPGSPGEKHY